METGESPWCSVCSTETKIHHYKGLFNTIELDIPFCPNCERIVGVKLNQIKLYTGHIKDGIDPRTGKFNMKVTYPEAMECCLLVNTNPKKDSKDSKERTTQVYPEIHDKVVVIGAIFNKPTLIPALIHNPEQGITTMFIPETIKVKKNLFSSFEAPDPIYSYARSLLEGYLIKDTLQEKRDKVN
jgi:hypothetical protein